jgi:ribonuclease P protein subunit POP4
LPITRQNLLAHEWIGLKVLVKFSPDPSVTDILGIVRDETRNTLLIEARNRLVSVPKSNAQFDATLPTGDMVQVEGALLRHRPEDRVKKGLAKW